MSPLESSYHLRYFPEPPTPADILRAREQQSRARAIEVQDRRAAVAEADRVLRAWSAEGSQG